MKTNREKFEEVFGKEIHLSFLHPGYIFIDRNKISQTQDEKMEEISKWLDAEYIEKERNN